MTIHEWQTHLHQLFGRRNAAFIPGRYRLIGHLLISVGAVADAVRHQRVATEVGQRLADVFGWTMAVANSFPALPLVLAMRDKWGSPLCTYCSYAPCQCPEHRPPRSVAPARPVAKIDNFQIWLNLTEWQQLLREKYFHRNSTVGLEACLNRLFKEVAEVAALEAEVAYADEPDVATVEDEYAKELSDVIAWLLSVGNLLGLDVEQAAQVRYGKSCPECDEVPCRCGLLMLDQGRFRRVQRHGAGTV